MAASLRARAHVRAAGDDARVDRGVDPRSDRGRQCDRERRRAARVRRARLARERRVFSLLYWQLDGGGPLARFRHERPYPDFLFTQQASPEFASPGWRPKFPDYLILGLTTSTAFSPTDVMPM